MSTKRKSKIKKRIIILITILALFFIAVFAILSRPKNNNYESVGAKSGDIKTYFSFAGNVEAKNRQNVMSEKVMQISDIKVKEGEKVKEGDVLFTTTMDDELLQRLMVKYQNLISKKMSRLWQVSPYLKSLITIT